MARTGKVTVVGAGFYGSTTAQRLAEYDIFDEVVLTDIVDGMGHSRRNPFLPIPSERTDLPPERCGSCRKAA